ncbi:hypothetical protein D7Y27_34090 [Corallococcus sp. AB004]|nr:hypothetical protein D7Y04_03515 [Corallococcus sp. AB038B]RKI33957.1 hypothetical protein D7Y27_34090 [Corallococcus sp. AB004]
MNVRAALEAAYRPTVPSVVSRGFGAVASHTAPPASSATAPAPAQTYQRRVHGLEAPASVFTDASGTCMARASEAPFFSRAADGFAASLASLARASASAACSRAFWSSRSLAKRSRSRRCSSWTRAFASISATSSRTTSALAGSPCDNDR